MISNRSQSSLSEIETISFHGLHTPANTLTLNGLMKTDGVHKRIPVAIHCADIYWYEFLPEETLNFNGEFGSLVETHPLLSSSRGCVTKSPKPTKLSAKEDEYKVWFNLRMGTDRHLYQIISHFGGVVRLLSAIDPKLFELPRHIH